jgi:hypothetical protein
MSKAQINAQARTMVYAYVIGVAQAGKPLDTAFDRLSVIAHLVTIPQLEQWMGAAIAQTQKRNSQN